MNNEENSKLIHADNAFELTVKKEKNKNQNYILTLNRLMKIIENTAKQGHLGLEFEAPSFVLDGCLGDKIKLARQLKKKLISLDYKVKRHEGKLDISWDKKK